MEQHQSQPPQTPQNPGRHERRHAQHEQDNQHGGSWQDKVSRLFHMRREESIRQQSETKERKLNAALMRKLVVKEEELKQSNQEIASLQAQLFRLNTALAAARRKHEGQQDKSTKEIAALQDELSTLQAMDRQRWQQTNGENSEAREEIGALQSEVKTLKTTLETKEKDLKKQAQSSLLALGAHARRSKLQEKKWEKERSTLQIELEDCKTKAKGQQEKQQEDWAMKAGWESTKVGLDREIGTLRKLLNEKEQEEDKLRKEIVALQKQAREAVSDIKKENDALKMEIKMLKADLENSEKEQQKKKKKWRKKKKALEEEPTALKELLAANEKQQTEIAALKEQVKTLASSLEAKEKEQEEERKEWDQKKGQHKAHVVLIQSELRKRLNELKALRQGGGKAQAAVKREAPKDAGGEEKEGGGGGEKRQRVSV